MEMRKTRSRTKNSAGTTDEKETKSPTVTQQNSIRPANESDNAMGSPSKSSQHGDTGKQTSSSKGMVPQKS